MSANGYKIKVNHESENREAQELFFKLGYIWETGLGTKNLDSKFLYAKNGILTMGFNSDTFDYAENKEITLEELRKLVCRNENGWISGADALRALADGKDVEYLYGDVWFSLVDEQVRITSITGNKFKFRLKPSTITINGIEVPAPFKPKNGEDFYYLDCTSDNYGGWAKTACRNIESDSFKNNTVFGAWRTEEEIKQVVAALRSVFKCN